MPNERIIYILFFYFTHQFHLSRWFFTEISVTEKVTFHIHENKIYSDVWQFKRVYDL